MQTFDGELDIYLAVAECRRLIVDEAMPLQGAAEVAANAFRVPPAEIARLAVVAIAAVRAAVAWLASNPENTEPAPAVSGEHTSKENHSEHPVHAM